MIPRISLDVCKEAFARWIEHNAARLGAALAYYTLLSLAPLLIFVVAVGAAFFGRHEAQAWILQEVKELVGPQGASAVHNLLQNIHHRPSSGVLAESIGIVTLLFGASGVFSELRDGLNTIWDAGEIGTHGWKEVAQSRLFAFGMVLAIGFLLLVSLIFSTTLATLLRYFSQLIPAPGSVLVVVNFIISIYAIAGLFTLIFKYVPHAHISWRSAWRGALFTAILFTVGKVLLGVYLGVAFISSAYGAAGSVVAVVVWVYYSAQIFYYGAEFTCVNGRLRDAGVEAAGQLPSQAAKAAGI